MSRIVEERNGELQSYAKVKKFIDPGRATSRWRTALLTPTLKVKRRVITEQAPGAARFPLPIAGPSRRCVLDGRVAIVTGASRGLGRAMAVALAGAGADVAVAARSRPDLEETAGLVRATGRRALAIATDVAVYAQVEALVARTVGELGGLHVVVNNSGIARVAPVAQMSPEDFRATLEVNLVGRLQRLPRRRAPPDRPGVRQDHQHGLGAGAGGAARLQRLRGVQERGDGVHARARRRVGAPQHPGQRGRARLVRHRHERGGVRRPRASERLLRDVPARRTGRLEEIGPLVVYLASAASDFMTGQTLFLDGGQSAA